MEESQVSQSLRRRRSSRLEDIPSSYCSPLLKLFQNRSATKQKRKFVWNNSSAGFLGINNSLTQTFEDNSLISKEHKENNDSLQSLSSHSLEEDDMLAEVRKSPDRLLRQIKLRKSKQFSELEVQNQLSFLEKQTITLLKIAQKYINLVEKQKEQEQSKEALDAELSKQHDTNVILHKKLARSIARYCTAELKCSEILTKQNQSIANEIPEIIIDQTSTLQDQINHLSELETKAVDSLSKIISRKNHFIIQLNKQIQKQEDNLKSMCIICQEKPVDCLFHPCNHACTCYSCAHSLKLCPMDRFQFSSIKKIFLS